MKFTKIVQQGLQQGQMLRNRLASVEGKSFIAAYLFLFVLFGLIQRHYPKGIQRKPRTKQV
eukprot:gene13545-9696_t